MESVWSRERENFPAGSKLRGKVKTDVLVVGGGIAGILCAWELKRRGIDCVLVEQHRIGGGNTANTTAKITVQHGLIYQHLIRRIGTEKTALYYGINQKAIERYQQLAARIPCDWQAETAWLYSTESRALLEREARAYEQAGIPFSWQEKPALPVASYGAVGIAGQARFHPLKLIGGLLKDLSYYEHTFVEEIRDRRALTRSGEIEARHIVLATHYPLVNVPGRYFMKLTQQRSYVLGLEGVQPVDGMYIDTRTGGYSFRNHEDLLLFGGSGNKTAKPCGGFTQLRQAAAKFYPGGEERYAWAAQDCMSLDQIPYIGVHRKSAQRLYVITGFNKWGMSGAMAGAMVIGDLIETRKSEYESLFSPKRPMAAGKLIANMASAAAGLVRPGKRCTHLGCGLKWNEQEKSWDCSCHGSRFDQTGEIMDNPAKRRISVEK